MDVASVLADKRMGLKALIVALALSSFAAAGHCQSAAPLDNGTPTVEGTPESAEAGSGAVTWRVNVAPLTIHFSADPDHRNVYMLGLERQRADGYLIGAAWFRNSFGQPSGYLYAGRRFERFYGHDPLYLELTAGVLYGYLPPYDHKVPLNYRGFSPGAVVALGWRLSPELSAQVNLLGNSALMFQLSADFH